MENTNNIKFIAEIGINHNGSLPIALKLMEAVVLADWDYVKFQKRTPELAVPLHQRNIIRETPWGKTTYLEYKKKIEFEQKEYEEIDKFSRNYNLRWSASVWDLKSLEFLLNFDPPFLKIPSAKLTDWELVKAAAKTQLDVFISCGMSSLEQIDKAINILETYGNGNHVLFYTVSSYPTPEEKLNLKTIPFLKARYRCPIGYSGHEIGIFPSLIAVSLGASWIERHITLDRNMWGRDHQFSLLPQEMKELKEEINRVIKILGTIKKEPLPEEFEALQRLRGKN